MWRAWCIVWADRCKPFGWAAAVCHPMHRQIFTQISPKWLKRNKRNWCSMRLVPAWRCLCAARLVQGTRLWGPLCPPWTRCIPTPAPAHFAKHCVTPWQHRQPLWRPWGQPCVRPAKWRTCWMRYRSFLWKIKLFYLISYERCPNLIIIFNPLSFEFISMDFCEEL